MNPPLRNYARIAGALYLVSHATSVLAVVAYRDAGSALGLRTGVGLELVLALACLGTGVALFPLLRPFGEVRAATFALLRSTEAAVILAGTLPMLTLARDTTAHASTTGLLLDLHDAAFLVGQGLVISVNTLVLASLLWQARLVPRALALLGLVGGTLVLTSNTAQLFDLIPANGVLAGICAVPIFAFEIWFAIYLIARGIRAPATRSRADGPQQ